MEQTPKADWKVILAIVLCGMIWLVWQNHTFQQQQLIKAAAAKKAAAAAASATPSAGAAGSAAPSSTTALAAASPAVATSAATAAISPARAPAEIVTLNNKVLELKISTDGARPVAADLKQYKSSIDATNDKGLVQLVATSNEGIAPLQAWFGDDHSTKIPMDAAFEKVSESPTEAVLRYKGTDGLTVTRTYTTGEDDYLVNLTEEIANTGTVPITGHPGLAWSANLRGGVATRTIGEFEATAYVNNRVQRGNPSKPGDKSWLVFQATEFEKSFTGKVDFVGVGDRYFVAAAVPLDPPFDGSGQTVRFFHPGAHSVAALAIGPETKLEPGASRVFKYQLYLGPKDYQVLQNAGHNLGESINWGWHMFEPIAKGFWYLFRWLHGFVGNWGVAIIVLTLIIRGALSPLAARQMKMSQDFAAKSAKLKPQLEKLKAQFADDPTKLNSETMRLYSQHGLSPFSPMMGCLPMLAQLPIWWALYKVLWFSIDLRQQPLGLWITDLAAPDPYKVLPILLGVVTFVQTKLTPQAPGTDPSQQKMMLYTMPVLFTVLMLSLPSGLVLYIFTSTLMNIAQQYYLRRKYPSGTTPVIAAPKEAT